MKQETVVRRFSCPRLGGVALVTIERHICDNHPDDADYHLKGVLFKGCAQKTECGIWQVKPYGAGQIAPGLTWDDCPAHASPERV